MMGLNTSRLREQLLFGCTSLIPLRRTRKQRIRAGNWEVIAPYS